MPARLPEQQQSPAGRQICYGTSDSTQANTHHQHLRGAAHLKDSFPCPFCKKVSLTLGLNQKDFTDALQGFTVASGVAHHLETGSCPRATNLNRESIYKVINARDTASVLTNKLLSWNGTANAEYVANAASWNGHAYECYLCHRDFITLAALNQHLGSPVHKQKLYRCFGGGCGKQFAALAQLFNHLESESCGAVRFGNVQKAAGDILTGQKRIEF